MPSAARRPLVVAAAVVAVVALVLAGAVWSAHRIETDLTTRAQAALTRAGLPVTVRYEGLDAVLTGTVARPQQGADAIGAVIGVTGTRHITSRLTIAPGSGPTPDPTAPQPDPAGTPSPSGSLRLPSGKITFATNDATITPAAAGYIDQVAAFLLRNPQVTISVRGHSDNSGTDEINWALSKQRAAAVVARLVSQQVAVQRMRSAAFAATSPIASNDTPDGRAANRRVELLIEGTP